MKWPIMSAKSARPLKLVPHWAMRALPGLARGAPSTGSSFMGGARSCEKNIGCVLVQP